MKDREKFLINIAALAQEANVDYKKPPKAGELIANLTQIIGSPISPSAIKRHLKQITQALENRVK